MTDFVADCVTDSCIFFVLQVGGEIVWWDICFSLNKHVNVIISITQTSMSDIILLITMYTSYYKVIQRIRNIIFMTTTSICPGEENECSARDSVKIGSCGAENKLSNGTKYVMIQ